MINFTISVSGLTCTDLDEQFTPQQVIGHPHRIVGVVGPEETRPSAGLHGWIFICGEVAMCPGIVQDSSESQQNV